MDILKSHIRTQINSLIKKSKSSNVVNLQQMKIVIYHYTHIYMYSLNLLFLFEKIAVFQYFY